MMYENKHKWTNIEDKIIIDSRNNHESYTCISIKLPYIKPSAIKSRFGKLCNTGKAFPKIKYTKELEDNIINLYNKKMPIKDIINEAKSSSNKIYQILYKYKIKLHGKNKYTVDKEYFNIINSEEKAYFLGLMYADGNIFRVKDSGFISISLMEEDIEILEKFKKSIKYTGPILYINKRNNIKKQRKLQICGKNLVNGLDNLGCFQKKSLILKFPTKKQVPRYLIHHFIRGYFDGDGSIYRIGKIRHCGIEIASTKKFLVEMSKYIPIDRFGIAVCSGSDKIYRYYSRNIKSVKIFNNFIYQNATVYLMRKYLKFQEVINLKKGRLNNAKL